MPSIINSDDGVVSGTSGLKTTGGNDGITTFQQNGTEQMRITAAGNVAIGTATADGQVHIKAATGQGVPLTLTATDASGNPQVVVKGSRTYQIGTGNASSGFAGSLFFFDGTAAATRMLIDSSGNLQFNSGYGSAAAAYGCRAWVNFNGTGTPAIREDGNVSSITDNGTGDYTVNFTTAMPDANYSIVGTLGETATGGNSVAQLYTPVAGSCRITSRASSTNAFQDSVNCCFSVFR